jgi:hypothetical protein
MENYVMRSYDPEVFKKATETYREKVPEDFPFEAWLEDRRNVMYDVDGNVGLGTFEYPGMYSAHWFFHAKGKEALDIAFKMYDDLFNNIGAKAVRGVTPIDLRGARYLAKRIGFTTVSFEDFKDGNGLHEVMVLTKEDFIRKQAERYGN